MGNVCGRGALIYPEEPEKIEQWIGFWSGWCIYLCRVKYPVLSPQQTGPFNDDFFDPVLIIGAENGLVWCNLEYFPDVRCAVTNQIGLTEGLCCSSTRSVLCPSTLAWIDTRVVLRFLHTEMQKIHPAMKGRISLSAINYGSDFPDAARCLKSF